MNLLLMGLNHRTAPVSLREQLAFSREGVAAALLLFREQFPNSEAAIISTCDPGERKRRADRCGGGHEVSITGPRRAGGHVSDASLPG